MLPPTGHEPVLLHETLEALALQPGYRVVDCTLGRAGHARAIAAQIAPSGTLIGLDVDPANLEYARTVLTGLSGNFRFFHANFAELDEVLAQCELTAVDAIVADLGLSTNQFLDARYGMSFSQDAPLDMRIDPRIPESAADLVQRLPESELADVLYELAQERYSRRIARKIGEVRRIRPIKSTGQLAEIVRSVLPRSRARGDSERIDPATRTFLALRMKVNRELENLRSLLRCAIARLRPGARFAVISFQSTEDREVKGAFRFAEQTGLVRIVTKKPITPSDTEIARNPRSRSSKLRVVEKL